MHRAARTVVLVSAAIEILGAHSGQRARATELPRSMSRQGISMLRQGS